jgi:hypothetical protein
MSHGLLILRARARPWTLCRELSGMLKPLDLRVKVAVEGETLHSDSSFASVPFSLSGSDGCVKRHEVFRVSATRSLTGSHLPSPSRGCRGAEPPFPSMPSRGWRASREGGAAPRSGAFWAARERLRPCAVEPGAGVLIPRRVEFGVGSPGSERALRRARRRPVRARAAGSSCP